MDSELPNLVDSHLATGSVDWPDITIHQDTVPAANSDVNYTAGAWSDGFTPAIVIMIGMGFALFYSLIAFAMGKTYSLSDWGDWLIPFLIVSGIGIAAYLSCVETQSGQAVCGPVGDCNTVQQSRYATLFGILPVGVLSLPGYVGLLAVRLTCKSFPKLAKSDDLAFFGMAVFAVIFLLYLTCLEPLVIHAGCTWCLISAVFVTLLLLLGKPPAVLQFSMSDRDPALARRITRTGHAQRCAWRVVPGIGLWFGSFAMRHACPRCHPGLRDGEGCVGLWRGAVVFLCPRARRADRASRPIHGRPETDAGFQSLE